MSFHRLLLALVLFAPLRFSAAALPFFSETVSWTEDVVLSDTRLFSVMRTVTYGADQFGRSGRGALKQQTISFQNMGSKVEWKSDESWPIDYMPDIFDFVDGSPVIVMPVHRFGPCKKFGFPQDGIVAYVFRNNRWELVTSEYLPKELKVNLLRSTHAVQYWPEYKGKRIGLKEKADLQGTSSNYWGPRLDDSIDKVKKFYAGIEDSCARIRPLSDPKFDDSLKRSIDSQNGMKLVSASIKGRTETTEQVSASGFSDAKGVPSGIGYISRSCSGVVKSIEPLGKYDENGGWQLIGHQLVINDNRKVPIAQLGLAKFQAPMQLEQVTCNAQTVYVIRRKSKADLLVHRFKYSGDLIDSVGVTLPETEKVIPGNGWGDVWQLAVIDNQLSLSIVNYTYPALANLGGTISLKQTYMATLP